MRIEALLPQAPPEGIALLRRLIVFLLLQGLLVGRGRNGATTLEENNPKAQKQKNPLHRGR